MDKDLIIAKNEISSIDKRTNIENVRFSLYSIIVTILLSKSIFKRNSDIENYLISANLHYKEYVFKSRTIVVSRVTRFIQTADHIELFNLVDSTKEVLFTFDKIIDKPTKKDESIDDLLKQFGRKR